MGKKEAASWPTGNDTINISLNNSQPYAGTPMATLHGGIGNDTFNIAGQGAKSIASIADWTLGNNQLNIAGLYTTKIADAAEAKKILHSFGYTYADQIQDDKILFLKDGSFTVTSAGNLNGTYFVNNPAADFNPTILVQLVGVDTQAELNQGTVGDLTAGGNGAGG